MNKRPPKRPFTYAHLPPPLLKESPPAAAPARALRRRAEQKVRAQTPPAETSVTAADARALVHELQVHQIELEMQNEELHRAHAEAREAAEQYAEMFDFAPVGYFVLDALGVIRAVNLAGAALLGLGRQRLVGQAFERYLAPDTRPAFGELCRRLRLGEARRACKVRLIQPGEIARDVLLEGTVAEAGPGQKQGWRVAATDITERQRAEEKLRELNCELEKRVAARTAELVQANEALAGSERRERERAEEFATLLAAVPTPVFIAHDPDCRHITGNRAADELLQNPHGAEASLSAPAGARPQHFRALKDGRELKLEELPAQRAARGACVRDFEFTLAFDDGTVRNVLGYGTPLLDEQGRPRGAVHVLVDITERKAAEERIRKLNAELEERVRLRTAELEAVNRELETFSYSVSHDLRAPLRTIDGFSLALLEDGQERLGPRQRDQLQRVRAGCQRMARLIEDLLNLSRLSRAEMCRVPVDLSALAQRAAEELQQSAPQRAAPFRIAGGLTAMGDAALLRVVLWNLLENAWKFTAKRAGALIEFGATTQPGPLEGRPSTVFYVRDNGVGFDMAYADKLFGAFQRLHSADEYPGTGIGLATVQRVISRHGGRIWAEAVPGQGATFYFTLAAGGASLSTSQ